MAKMISTGPKFAFFVLGLVVVVAVGLQVSSFFPSQSSKSATLNTNSNVNLKLADTNLAVQNNQLLGIKQTITLPQAGSDVALTTFNQNIAIGFREGTNYFVQLYTSTYQPVQAAGVIIKDIAPVDQPIYYPQFLVQGNSLFFVYGKAVQNNVVYTVTQFANNWTVQHSGTLTTLPTTTDIVPHFAVDPDGNMFMVNEASDGSVALTQFNAQNMLVSVQHLTSLGTIVQVYATTQAITLVSQLNTNLLITKYSRVDTASQPTQAQFPLPTANFTVSNFFHTTTGQNMIVGQTVNDTQHYQVATVTGDTQVATTPTALPDALNKPQFLLNNQHLIVVQLTTQTKYQPDGSTLTTTTPQVEDFTLSH